MLRGITYNDMLCGSCLFFAGEIFHELSTFEGIYSIQVANIQHSLELRNVFHAFAIHP